VVYRRSSVLVNLSAERGDIALAQSPA